MSFATKFIFIGFLFGISIANFTKLADKSTINHNATRSPIETYYHHFSPDFLFNEEEKHTNENNKFKSKANLFATHLRHIANIELGIIKFQDYLNGLPFVKLKDQDGDNLKEMVSSFDATFRAYKELVVQMADTVQYDLSNVTDNSRTNYEYNQYSVNDESQRYYPCCVIPDHYLRYDPHFGTRVNNELWCDSGLDPEQSDETFNLPYFPPNLTPLFLKNRKQYPNIKWQFFMSSQGVHTEYPAHRPGTSVGSECGMSSRHHNIYESIVRPSGRNIVILYDLGNALRPRILLTAKAIGHYILNTLNHNDNIAMLGAGEWLSFPSSECLKQSLMPGTFDVKQNLQKFIDYLEIQDAPTNHTLGLISSVELISNWALEQKDRKSILVIYITCGLVNGLNEINDVMRILGRKVDSTPARIIFSSFGLGMSFNEPSLQNQFVNVLSSQQYENYDAKVSRSHTPGQVIEIRSTLRVAPVIRTFYDVVDGSQLSVRNQGHNSVSMSEPYWDKEGNGMVITFAKEVRLRSGVLVGVVGLDVSLSFLIEGALFYQSTSRKYALVIDKNGNILSHPKMGRPEKWLNPLIPTHSSYLETYSSFVSLLPHFHNLPHGIRRSDGNKGDREYLWRRTNNSWVFIISREMNGYESGYLSAHRSFLPKSTISHRLDRLSPQQAKVCRHFNQMATLDKATLFVSRRAFQSSSIYKHTDILTYLTDETKTVANPGLKRTVREEASTLYHVTRMWMNLSIDSNLQKFIIRRYGATKSGVMFTYPGTLLDKSYDPNSQDWYIQAAEKSGEIAVSSPFLDPAGSGYIITVSQAVYEVLPSFDHASPQLFAVLATDFTLGFWHKLIADVEPICSTSIYFQERNLTESSKSEIRCFLIDTSGKLIVHPSFVHPNANPKVLSFPRHITDQEPFLASLLLGGFGAKAKQDKIMVKHWCGQWWHRASKRFYSVSFENDTVTSSLSNEPKKENPCIKYILTRIPGTNLAMGIMNQTCITSPAFCPCSRVDKRCLTCQLMEPSTCECPCECAMPNIACSRSTLFNGERFSTKDKSLSSNQREEDFLLNLPSCPRQPEPSGFINYGVGMISQLETCHVFSCQSYTNARSCMGVLNCVWCVLQSDRQTPLNNPYCTEAARCYSGVIGGPSPYPTDVSPMPHLEEMVSTMPIGTVLGGILAVLLLVGFTVYCYRAYVVPNAATSYTPTILQNGHHDAPIYIPNPCSSGKEGLLNDGVLSVAAAATMSPYRMNPSYRRPAGYHRETSDPGYSTMTPHDESENLTCTDYGASSMCHPSGPEDERMSSENWSETSDNSSHTGHRYLSHCKKHLSSPKKIGPNRVIVPVTVHKVDIV